MYSKKLIVFMLLGMVLIFSSKSIQSQPSMCWEKLVLKPESVNADINSHTIKGQVVDMYDVHYFEKLQHNEVGIQNHFADGTTEYWTHLTLYITGDTNLTIYSSKTMTTNWVMGMVKCYDISRAKEILNSKYPGYLQGNMAIDTLSASELLIYMGDEHFPKGEYASFLEGKVIITYNIETGEATWEFTSMVPTGHRVFKLPKFEIN